jgi:hypothetical protein
MFVILMLTRGNTALLLSLTVPEITPVSTCASNFARHSEKPSNSTANGPINRDNISFLLMPDSRFGTLGD